MVLLAACFSRYDETIINWLLAYPELSKEMYHSLNALDTTTQMNIEAF